MITFDVECSIYVFAYKDEIYAVVENPYRLSESDLKNDRWFTDLTNITEVHDQINDGTPVREFPNYTELKIKISATPAEY